MKVSVIEPNHHGHTFTYVRHILAALKQTGCDVTFHCTENGALSKEFANHLFSSMPANIDSSLRPLGTGRFRVYQNICQSLRHVNQTATPDAIVYPTADFAAVAAGLGRMQGNNPLSATHNFCMMTKIGFSYPGTERAVVNGVEKLGLRLSTWDRIGVIDTVAFMRLTKKKNPFARRLRLFPDPISITTDAFDKQACRAELGLDPDAHVFLCPGIIRAGKGVRELLDGVAALPTTTPVILIFMGPVRHDVKVLLKRPEYLPLIASKRVLVVDRSLSERELGAAIVAADVVCCLYPKQNHPSSIAITSLAYNRPVLYSDTLWLGSIGSKFKIGFGCNPFDSSSVASAMKTAILSCEQWALTPAARQLLRYQSSENFISHWVKAFQNAQGRQVVDDAVEWEHVLDSCKEGW